MRPWRRILAAAVVLILFVAGRCPPTTDPPPALNISDILIQKPSGATQPFGVDICLDATPSMEGFAADPDSAYRKFLEDLEGSFVSEVKNVSSLRFFKFGERIREVTREEFRNARGAAFYHEPGIFKDTNIELVLRKDAPRQVPSGAPAQVSTASEKAAGDPAHVTVVVTDLFQKDQDVNILIQQIKDGCLMRADCSVGVLAIPSEFDGMVYDARVPSYRYRSTSDPVTFRPFYLLMFGPEEQLLRFADVLSSKRYIDLKHLLVIGPRIVTSFSVDVARDASAQGITPRKAIGSSLDSAFNLRKGYSDGKLIARVNLVRDGRTFDYNPTRAEVSFTRETGGKRVPAAGEVSVDSVGKSGDVLELRLNVSPPAQKGDYTYVCEVAVGEVNGFVLPKWASDFSSSNPTPEHEPAKTLNLDRLLERLTAASILQDHHKPKLARFRILIHRL